MPPPTPQSRPAWPEAGLTTGDRTAAEAGTMRTNRVFHAVDSHTEGMPTRVITGGVGVIPGAIDVRPPPLLPRQHGRDPHAPDERAARPRGDERRDPPAADPPGRRLRRALHRGVRLPADVRARHDRRGDGAGRDRHGRGDRAGHDDPARHAGRPRRRRGARGGRGRQGGDDPQCALVRRGSRSDGGRARLRRRRLRHGVRRQLLRHRGAGEAGSAVRPRRQERAAGGGPRDHGRDQPGRHARASGEPGDRRRPPRLPRGTRLGRPPLAPRDGDPPRLVRPLPVRHRHLGPDGPAARARRAAAAPGLPQRVVHRDHVHRPAGRGDDGRRAIPAVIPTITGRAWVTGTAQYMLDPDDPFPEGFEL